MENDDSKNPKPKRIAEFARSLKELGEIEVTDWDFMELLNKDIKDLEIGRSLRKLGNTKVIDWDFKNAIPAVHRFAHQEVDVAGWMKKAANYKVLEWEIPRPSHRSEAVRRDRREIPDGVEMQELLGQLKNYLQFVAVNLIAEPDHARISVEELGHGVARFKLVVTKNDAGELIGRNGFTAAAIRNLLKAGAEAHGVQALLEIRSHEEEATLSLRKDG